jgi:uncharacterized phiE125 gp8 family phage protein
MSIKRITQPSAEPVLLADVKAQLSIATADTLVDAIITRRIIEARQWAENFMGRTIMPSNWEIVLDRFPNEVELFYPPATAIVSITYVDTYGVTQTMDSADYYLDEDAVPNWVLPVYGEVWPDTLDIANAVRVRYTAGYADAASVPSPIKEAIMLTIGHWMRYQGAVEAGVNITRIPNAVECLLTPYKVFSF